MLETFGALALLEPLPTHSGNGSNSGGPESFNHDPGRIGTRYWIRLRIQSHNSSLTGIAHFGPQARLGTTLEALQGRLPKIAEIFGTPLGEKATCCFFGGHRSWERICRSAACNALGAGFSPRRAPPALQGPFMARPAELRLESGLVRVRRNLKWAALLQNVRICHGHYSFLGTSAGPCPNCFSSSWERVARCTGNTGQL